MITVKYLPKYVSFLLIIQWTGTKMYIGNFRPHSKSAAMLIL